MQIDWFTFCAQVVNFLVLAFLLRRFLYVPVLDAMDRREASIKAGMREALLKKEEAEAAEKRYRELSRELEEKRAELIARAEQEALGRKKELIHQARAELGEQRDLWAESLRREKEVFLKELRKRAGDELWNLARKTLRDLAGEDIENCVVRVFIDKLKNIDDAARGRMAEAIKKEDGRLVVRSAFALPGDKLDDLTRLVRDTLVDDAELRFDVSPDITAGIEIKAGGCKIAWSIGDYLDTLETRLNKLIDDETERLSGESAEQGGEGDD